MTRYWRAWWRSTSSGPKRKGAAWCAGCGRTTRFPVSPRASTSRGEEQGAQVAAELIAAVEQKPSFPTGAVEQTAAVFGALAAAGGPLDARGLAAQFKRTKTTEKKVGEVLASLARLGYVISDDGKAFALRRVA